MNANFTALVVTPHELILARVDNTKKKLIKAAIVPIPEGMVTSGVITKAPEFALFLKSTFNAQRISEKTVGIVIPEVSTLIKIVSIPLTSRADLDEAIRWQMRDYLPINGTLHILDWKIISRTKEEAVVQVVAAKADVIQGIVDAVASAGYIPMIVETPAIALERLIPRSPEACVAVYIDKSEALIIAIEDGKILGSTIVFDTKIPSLSQEISKIISHYATSPVKKIFVGGPLLSETALTDIKTILSIETGPLTIGIQSASPADIQTYLLALSLTRQNYIEPNSEVNINLLPADWVRHFKKQLREIQMWTGTLVTSVIAWSLFLVSLSVYMLLSTTLTELSNQKIQADSTVLTSAVAEINTTNKIVSQSLSVLDSIKTPFEPINKVNKLIPEGVTVLQYSVNTETGKIDVGGRASTNEVLLSFKNALTQEKSFQNVALPLASLLTEADTTFAISFTYEPYAPKKAPSQTLTIPTRP